jgi:hypothetical protein
MLENYSVELGTQEKEIVLQVAWRRTIRDFLTVPWEFDIKPRVTSWGKFTLATTLCTWSPGELAPLLSVITGQINISQLYSHTSGDLHGSISELMAMCVCRSFRSAAWSSHCLLDLARSISRCVTSNSSLSRTTLGPGRRGCSEQGGCSKGGGSVVIPQLGRFDTADLGLRQHGDVPHSTCHIDMCLVTCSGHVHRLTNSRSWWCFFGSGNGEGSATLPTSV